MSYNQYQSNQYNPPPPGNPYNQAPAQESGYGHGYRQEEHEMQSYGQQPSEATVLSQSDFLSRVSYVRNQINSLSGDVQQIATLHQRALAGNDPLADAQLNNWVAATQIKNTSIRSDLRSLKIDAERTTDATRAVKTRQFESLNKDFKQELQKYLAEEQQSKERYKEQIARQYRIVNPNASNDEVQSAVEADWGNEGIFQQALRSNRSGQANAVLGAVRARHNEMQKIEESIKELVSLFEDIDTLVVMQEATVVRAEEQTEQTNQHLAKGNEEVQIATDHARRRRKLKWWCLAITILIILIAVGVGVGVYFSQRAANNAVSGGK